MDKSTHPPILRPKGRGIKPEEIEKCYQLGASSYVQKPVGFDNYIEAIKKIHSFWLDISTIPSGDKYS
jgi:hypothetical protein